jgi:hypothetical protein
MKIKNYKSYLPFGLSMLLFFVVILWLLSLYFNLNGKLEEETKVEIKLPVIEWNKYMELPKQYEPNKVDR